MAKKSLIGSSIESRRLEQDLVVREVDEMRDYMRTIIEITNSSGDTVEYPVGTVVADAALADNATPQDLQPAFTDAITTRFLKLADGESADVPAIVRGPCVLNFDEVERLNDEETDEALMTRLGDLVSQGVRFTRHPAATQSVDLNG